MGKGYTGKILIVDLSSGEINEEIIPDEIYEQYLSGTGLGAYVVNKYVPAGADPLGPDNMIGFMTGILTGTGSLFTGRWMVVGKSPLTGGWGDANCGGNFSPSLKRCGFDGIFFKGASEKPVYLFVENGKQEIRDAGEVWGKDTVETEEFLIKTAGSKRKPKVVCIGPAGENLSLISGVANDRGRMAARSGLGAVMGSKKLKAVVLSGSKKIKSFDKDEIKKLTKKCNKFIRFQPPLVSGAMLGHTGTLMRLMPSQMAMDGIVFKLMLRKWGTPSLNQFSIEMGDSPLKNWKGSNKDFDKKKSGSVNSDRFIEKETVKYHCYSCPLGCGGICSTKGEYSETHKPEYETILSLGGLCMNEDIDSIFYLNELLNRAGMDTISAGGVVAFAIECFEKNIITTDDTGGLELSWGNTEAIKELIRKMISREGIGDKLADGVKVAAEKIGSGSEEYAIHAGGQELPMHDGRNDPGYALHYAVEPTPGRHTIGAQQYYEMYQLWQRVKNVPKIGLFSKLYMKSSKYDAAQEKAEAAAACSRFMNVLNGAGGCSFGALFGVHRVPFFEWLNAATGWDKTPDEYMKTGERIQTLKQNFNIKHGVDPKKFIPNKRALGSPPITHGANKGRTVNIEKMMKDYWNDFGWDNETGKPTAEKLKELGINE